jgi:aminopeptidase N
MSTYLVAFVVSDFKHRKADSTGNNVTTSIWARENALDQTEYARSIAGRILHYFEEFFDVNYPLPKQVRNGIIIIICHLM